MGFLAALSNPAGRIIAAVVIALVYTGSVYIAGYRAHQGKSREIQYKAERDAALRDLYISQQAQKVAEDLADQSERESAEAKRKAEEYAKSLKQGGSADLDDSDVKRLRDIRNRKKR